MKKKIFRSTLILIISSTVAKILSFGVRIYLGRMLSFQAMNLYSLAMPSLVFLISFAQFGIPSALSKVIAQSKNPLHGIYSSILLSLGSNFVLIVSFLFLLPVLSKLIFNDTQMSDILKAMIAMIPMVSLSGICKGILQGKQHHLIASNSQIFEEIFRLVYLFLFFSKPLLSAKQLAQGAMSSVFIGECGSTLFMLLAIFILKNPIDLRKIDLKKEHFKQILSLSIPMTSARLLGSLTYFVEPLIFLSLATSSLTLNTYGALNGYVLPILTMPSFLSVTLSNVLLPSFVYEKAHNHLNQAKKIFFFIAFLCMFIGCCSGLICFFFSKELLILFFKNDAGSTLLKLCAFPFIFYALQPVFSALLHALDLSKQALLDTFIGCVIRIGVLFFTPLLGEYTLVIALCCGMLVTTLMHAWRVFVSLKVL